MAFCSCSKEHVSSFTDLFVSKESANVMSVSLALDSIRNPYMIECSNEHLFFVNINQPTFITEFDLKTGEYLIDYLNRGDGPNEFLHFTTISTLGDSLVLWDTNKETLAYLGTNYDAMTTIPTPRQVKITSNGALLAAFKVLPLRSDLSAATGLVKEKRIALIDGAGKVVVAFGDYPREEKDKKYTDSENGFAYQSQMAYQHNKQVLAVGSCYGESISFYNIEDEKSPRLIKEYCYSYPQYRDDSNGQQYQSVIFDKNNVFGIIDMKASSEHCICLFSGEVYSPDRAYGGQFLLLFNWSGNPVKMIKLDQLYANIAINEKEQEVYLLGNNPNTLDFIVAKVRL